MMAQKALPLPIRPGPRQRRWLSLTLAALWASGGLWLLFHYFMQQSGRFGPVPHPLEYWWLRVHGLVAMFALLAVGSMFAAHIPRAWQRGRHRASGAFLLLLFAALMGTGYALYYFSSDSNAAWLPLLHWLPGLGLPLVLSWHLYRARTVRRRKLAPAATRSFSKPLPDGAAGDDAIADATR